VTPGGGPRRRAGVGPIAALLVAGALLVACSSPTGNPSSKPPAGGPLIGAAASSSRVAELEAALTSALVERVYATAAARSAALRDRSSSAGGTLDRGSLALADLLGAAGTDTRDPLAAALRRVDELQAADARAAGSPDATRTRSELEQAQRDLATSIRRVVPALTVNQVSERLLPDLAAQVAAGSETPYEGLRAAATRARETARVVAAAIAEERRLGAPGARAAALRADLTGLLTEHVLLTGSLAAELGGDGRLSAGATSARAALDANTRALTELVGVAYPAAAEPFGRGWSAHTTRLEAHAAEVAASGDTSGSDTGGGDTSGGNTSGGVLQDAPDQLAQLFAGTVEGLPVDRLAAELAPLIQAQLQALAAAARGAPEAAADLRVAAARATVPAALLAAAIAQHLRLG